MPEYDHFKGFLHPIFNHVMSLYNEPPFSEFHPPFRLFLHLFFLLFGNRMYLNNRKRPSPVNGQSLKAGG